MNRLLFVILAVVIASQSYSQNKSMVQVNSYIQRIDEYAPWKRLSIDKETFSAVAVEPQKLLVSASVVRFAKYLELSTITGSQRIPLHVDFVDYSAQLALLTFQGDFKLQPIEIGENIKVNTRVKFKVIKNRRIIDLNTRVREIRTMKSATANYNLPTYVTEIKQSGLGFSDPVFYKNKLTAFAVRRANNIVFSLPSSLIKKFIINAKEKKKGFVRIGFSYEKLTSRELRAFVGAKDDLQGVLVTRVSQNSPFYGKLRKGDILTQVGSYTIDDQGFTQVPQWGKIPLTGLLYRFSAHEDLVLTVVRKGQTISLSAKPVPFTPRQDAIPYLADQARKFTIFGGFVFIELTQNYLMAWGKNWTQEAPLFLLYRFFFKNFLHEDRSVLLSKVLADEYNRGYTDLKNDIVLSVDNKPIHTIDDLKLQLKQAGEFIRISLGPVPTEVIMSRNGNVEANKRIAKAYSIAERHFIAN